MNWRPTLWLVALAVVALDQATKQWALSELDQGRTIEIWGDWLSFELVFNSGAAFSFMRDHTWILTVVVIAVTAVLVMFARKARAGAPVWIFGVGLGGAIGNLLDRLLREPGFAEGHVVDMINYGGFFVGNVADIAIVGAAAIAVLRGLLGKSLLEPEVEPASTSASESTPSS